MYFNSSSGMIFSKGSDSETFLKIKNKPTAVKNIRLLLIRHGESAMNTSPDYICGQMNDVPLTEKGECEAEALGKMLKISKIKFDLVFCSPATRAYDTSVICLNNMNTNVITWTSDLLLERSQGDWSGHIRSEVHTDDIINEIKRDPLNHRAPNGESQRDVGERMMKFINDEIFTQYRIDNTFKTTVTIAVFTHGFAIKCLLRHILNSDPNFTWKISIDNTSITELYYDHHDWHIRKLNDTSHYVHLDEIQRDRKFNKNIIADPNRQWIQCGDDIPRPVITFEEYQKMIEDEENESVESIVQTEGDIHQSGITIDELISMHGIFF